MTFQARHGRMLQLPGAALEVFSECSMTDLASSNRNLAEKRCDVMCGAVCC
jgi:hypothetical protein